MFKYKKNKRDKIKFQPFLKGNLLKYQIIGDWVRFNITLLSDNIQINCMNFIQIIFRFSYLNFNLHSIFLLTKTRTSLNFWGWRRK